MSKLFSTLMSVLIVSTLVGSYIVSAEESPTTSSEKTPNGVNSAESYGWGDIGIESVDKTGEKLTELHIDVHYVHTSIAPIPEFVLAIEDEKGKELGTVKASKVNYSYSKEGYTLIAPLEKGLSLDEIFKVVFKSGDKFVSEFKLKTFDQNNNYITDVVMQRGQSHELKVYPHTYYDTTNADKVIETKDLRYGYMSPVNGELYVNSNIVAIKTIDQDGKAVTNTSLVLHHGKEKMDVKTDALGYIYVNKKDLKSALVDLSSSKWQTVNKSFSIPATAPGQFGVAETAVILVPASVDLDSEPIEDAAGVLIISHNSDGDTTISKNWMESEVTLKSSDGETLKFTLTGDETLDDIYIKNGTYEVSVKSQYANVEITSSNLVINSSPVELGVTVSPKYTFEVSKEGSGYDFSFVNIESLETSNFIGNDIISFGVAPGESYMIRDNETGKVYTAVIKEDTTVTKLVLGVGVVWGGDVSTPHTGDNIIFLLALFFTSLALAGVSFYFYKTSKKNRNLVVTAVLILVLLFSMLPLNVAHGTSVGIGNSGGGDGRPVGGDATSTGTLQVDSSLSLVAITLVPNKENDIHLHLNESNIYKDVTKYMGAEYIPYTFYYATDAPSYNAAKASNTGFMYYDNGLVPLWGAKNIISKTDTELADNRSKLGIANTSFGDRVLPFYQVAPGTLGGAWDFNGYVPDNGTNIRDPKTGAYSGLSQFVNQSIHTMTSSTYDKNLTHQARHPWTGDFFSNKVSTSRFNTGDVYTLWHALEFFDLDSQKALRKQHFDSIGSPQSVESQSRSDLSQLSDSIFTLVSRMNTKESYDWYRDTLKPKKESRRVNSEGAELFEELEVSTDYAIIIQTLNAVRPMGASDFTFMTTNEMFQWYDAGMKTANTGYKNLNLGAYDVAKNAARYANVNVSSLGDGNPVNTKHPTFTFTKNTYSTTVKAIHPRSILGELPARTELTIAQTDANPFSSWGYTLFNLHHDLGDTNSPTTGSPSIEALVKYNIYDESGNFKETKTYPFDLFGAGKSKYGLETFDHYEIISYNTTKVEDGFILKADTTKQAKIRLYDISDNESLLKPAGNQSLNNFELRIGVQGVSHYDIPYSTASNGSDVVVGIQFDWDIPLFEQMYEYLKLDKSSYDKYLIDYEASRKSGSKVQVSLERTPNSVSKYPKADTKTPMTSDPALQLGRIYSNAMLELEIDVVAKCVGFVQAGGICTDIGTLNPDEAYGSHVVPEWRLSKYFEDNTPNDNALAKKVFKVPAYTWYSGRLTNSGSNRFSLVSPDYSSVLWAETKARADSGETLVRTIDTYGGTYDFKIGGDLLAIKENTSVTGTRLAGWINSASALGSKVGVTYTGSPDARPQASITKSQTFRYGVKEPYSSYSYSELETYCFPETKTSKAYCYDTREQRGNATITETESVNHISVTFKRHLPTDNKTVITREPKKVVDNGTYWSSEQSTSVLRVNPEVSMIADDRNGNPSVVVTAGDYLRTITPTVYNSLKFKGVTVTPKVDGMSVATDAQAKALASRIGVGNLDLIYKGASTSVNFDVNKQSSIIELKTYALDIGNSALKNTWGNTGYSTDTFRDKFLAEFGTREADGTWALTPTLSGKYVINNKDEGGVSEVRKISQKGYSVREHTLTIRGGKVVAVNGVTDFNQLDAELKDAIERMNISTAVGQNVFHQFERGTGAVLDDSRAASLINSSRGSNDLVVGQRWYYEDTSSLVVREYVTTYEVPSYMYVDKIPQDIVGLATPMDKNQFFSQGFVGHAKYRVQVRDAYMEYNSSTPSPFGGVQTKLFGVPNVSVTDTVQFN